LGPNEESADGRESVVFIVDDDAVVRRVLTVLVESMQLRPKAYESAREFLDAYDSAQPGCLLLDVRMPGMSGLELLERLAAKRIHPPAILISAHGDVPTVVRGMKAGALTFLEKPCRDYDLWAAIQEALHWDTENRQRLAVSSTVERRISQLTPGEGDVLQMLVRGKSNKAIAAELGLSVRTIEVRRAKVMKKMQAESLAQLVRLIVAVRNTAGERQPSSGNAR